MWGSVTLVPGVNVERTPTLNRAGFSSGSLIRFRDLLVQKYGGWQLFYPFALNGVPRELHAWEDLNSVNHVGVGTTLGQFDISNGNAATVTPQTKTTNITPDGATIGFTTTSSSRTVTITDTNINTVTTLDSIYLTTPVAVGGLILAGPYQIQSAGSPNANSYTITAATAATSSVTLGGTVPQYTTSSGSATVTVTLTAHGLSVGSSFFAQVSTTANGVTIYGKYILLTVPTANSFTIAASNTATGSGSFYENSGTSTNLVQIVYYLQIGPVSSVTGYGTGPYGQALYGTGGTISVQTGDPITATDWTSDNWGQLWLTCPRGGPVYVWDPTAGSQNAGVVSTAPFFNGGLFVSMAQQILICWASTANYNLGYGQDPMLIRWSDQGDYTNFTATTTNQAGSFRIPIGSTIRGGMAVSNQNLFWTDLDLWAANYAGFPLVYGFNKIGAGAGAISSHCMQQLRDGVYWMGGSNFYKYGGGGVQVIPCPVWDAVYQNLNTTYSSNVRSMPNTGFNEVGWLFPSSASVNGECDTYVKFNITEQGQPWDFGPLARSAWMDQSVVGTPVGAVPSGVIYQHEMTNDGAGAAITATFTTGYFYIAEGEEFAFVDLVIPDMKWGTYGSSSSATVVFYFNTIDWPGDTPTVFGPYTMTSTTQYITVRIRARQMSITMQSSDLGSFWRLGNVRYRYSAVGRR